MSDNDLFVAVAATPLNFYPGTLNPTPPDYRRRTVSEPMPHRDALAKLAEWASVVEAPGWEFSIEPAERSNEPLPPIDKAAIVSEAAADLRRRGLSIADYDDHCDRSGHALEERQ